MTTEDIRHEVLDFLFARPATAATTDAIFRQLARDHRGDAAATGTLTLAAVLDALHFLAGLGHITSSHDPLGPSQYWQITPAARLAKERGEI